MSRRQGKAVRVYICRKDPELVSSAAFNYLMLMGTVIGGWQLARGALVATTKLATDGTDPVFLRTQVLMARFYAEHVLPRVLAYRQQWGATR